MNWCDVEAEQRGDLGVELRGGAGHHLAGPLQPGLPGGRPTVALAHDPHRGPSLVADVEVEAHPALRPPLRRRRAPTSRSSPKRGTVPYRAKIMASMTLDLPAPVGPVSANRSTPSKSTTVRSRKAVKPSSSSRTGLTGAQSSTSSAKSAGQRLVDLAPRGRQVLPEQRRRFATVAVDSGAGRTVGATPVAAPGGPGRSTWTSTQSAKRSRTSSASPTRGALPQPDAEVVVPGRPGLGQHLVQRALQRAEPAAARSGCSSDLDRPARVGLGHAAPTSRSAVSPKSSCSGEPA